MYASWELSDTVLIEKICRHYFSSKKYSLSSGKSAAQNSFSFFRNSLFFIKITCFSHHVQHSSWLSGGLGPWNAQFLFGRFWLSPFNAVRNFGRCSFEHDRIGLFRLPRGQFQHDSSFASKSRHWKGQYGGVLLLLVILYIFNSRFAPNAILLLYIRLVDLAHSFFWIWRSSWQNSSTCAPNR